MKKIFTILCAALIGFSTASAEVLLTEHFAQTTTTLATNTDAMPYSGEIAIEGWTNIMGTTGDIYVNQSNDLTYTGYKSATDGTGSAEFKSSYGRRDAAALNKSIKEGSIYLAGIVKITAVEGTGKDYIWSFGVGTSGLNSASSKHYARPFVKASGSGFKFGIAKLDENTDATVDYTDEYAFGTYLVVVEYKFVTGDKNDEINLFINPVKGSKPTATLVPKASVASTKTDASTETGFGSIILYSSNSSKAACLIDELKVVTDWADLWETGDEPQEETPTIIADNSLAFGNVYVGEATDKKITVKGSDLKGAISVASSNNQVEVSAASISKEDAEAADGAEITVTLTAAAAGEGSATITLSSQDAANKVINVTWNGVQPIPSVTNIVALKTVESGSEYSLNSEPIVVGFIEDAIVIQDASGAIVLTNLMDRSERYASLKIGDKLSDIQVILIDEEDYVHAFTTATLINEINIKSFDNDIEPLEVTTATIAQYGPAYIKLEQVEFTDLSKNSFTAGWFNISQNSVAARIQVPDGCDIIGEAVPAKADVKGLLIYANGGIAIAASADITNRVARSTTAVDNARLNDKARKFVRDGQLYIIRDGKTFNVLGTQISE